MKDNIILKKLISLFLTFVLVFLIPIPEVIVSLDTAHASSQEELTASLKSLVVSDEEFVYSQVNFSSSWSSFSWSLTEDNIYILEDGTTIDKDEYFQVSPPSENSSSNIADIIFIIDDSWSMWWEQTQVKSNIKSFADDLVTESIDIRLGIVQFWQSSDWTEGYEWSPIIKSINWSNLWTSSDDDINDFKDVIDSFNASWWLEPSYDSIWYALQNYSFREGSQKIIILITDEYSNFNRNYDLSSIKTYSKEQDAQIFTMVWSSWQSDYEELSSYTWWESYDITDDFSWIFDEIKNNVSENYQIIYKISNPEYWVEKTVEIWIENSNDYSSNSVTWSYTLWDWPIISIYNDWNNNSTNNRWIISVTDWSWTTTTETLANSENALNTDWSTKTYDLNDSDAYNQNRSAIFPKNYL